MANFLKGCLIVVVVVAALAALFMGWCAKKGYEFTRDGVAAVSRRFDGEWDAEERKADPAGYCDHLIDRLKRDVRDLGDASKGLEESGKTLARKREEGVAKRAEIAEELERLRSAHRAAKAAGAWPVEHDGKSLSEDELRRLVAALLGRAEALGEADRRYAETIVAAEATRAEIATRIMDTEGKIALLEAEREIVRVGKARDDVERIFAEAGDVVVKNRAVAERSPVRTVEDLMHDRGVEAARPASAGVDAFLGGK